jgi:uncharacterized membrane protein HdeD (DUF308 family)
MNHYFNSLNLTLAMTSGNKMTPLKLFSVALILIGVIPILFGFNYFGQEGKGWLFYAPLIPILVGIGLTVYDKTTRKTVLIAIIAIFFIGYLGKFVIERMHGIN